jgi:hypothetical protein
METIKITSMPKNHRAEQVYGLMNEYYSFIHAWFIHRFLREKILVIHSSCAWIIHLFTLDGNAYSWPSKEEERKSINQSVCLAADLQAASKLQVKQGK